MWNDYINHFIALISVKQCVRLALGQIGLDAVNKHLLSQNKVTIQNVTLQTNQYLLDRVLMSRSY